MLTKYEPCRSYLEKKLYPSRNSWARYSIAKVFTAGIESTQRVESLNGVLKKHVNRGTLLTELVKEIENELDKESQYNRIKDYYGANPSNGLPSTYDTIFKDIDSVLKDFLAPIPLSLQRAQMKQALLYQGTLVPIEQINESDEELGNIIEHIYDRPQIRLRELLIDIDEKEIQEIWEVNYIAASSSTKPHYVVIFGDMTLLCTCMYIINQGCHVSTSIGFFSNLTKLFFTWVLFIHVGLDQYYLKQTIILQLIKELQLIQQIHCSILIKCELLTLIHQLLEKMSIKRSNSVLVYYHVSSKN